MDENDEVKMLEEDHKIWKQTKFPIAPDFRKFVYATLEFLDNNLEEDESDRFFDEINNLIFTYNEEGKKTTLAHGEKEIIVYLMERLLHQI